MESVIESGSVLSGAGLGPVNNDQSVGLILGISTQGQPPERIVVESRDTPMLRIPSWDDYQHYKDRDPPWIKLHRSLLTDYKFGRLQDASKAHLIGIWLLASQMQNLIPADPQWIAQRINATTEINLKELVDKGFIELASGSLADCKQLDIVETYKATEAEAYKATEADSMNTTYSLSKEESFDAPDRCPYQEIIKLYHEILPDHPRVKEMSSKRRSHMKARWSNGMEKSMDNFRGYFEAVKRSRFLTGRVDPPPGKRTFMADFDFLMRESTYIKILEGKYRD